MAVTGQPGTETGTPAATPTPTPGAQPAPAATPTGPQDAAARRAATKAAILAGAHRAQAAAAAPAPAPAAGAQTPAQPAAVPDPALPDDAGDDDPPGDPQPVEGQALLRRQEQHLRRQIAEERASIQSEFSRRERTYQDQIEKLTAQVNKFSNARQDPFGAFEALGFASEDYPALYTAFYALTPDGQKDPKLRAHAQTLLAQRGQVSEVEKVKNELAEIKKAQQVERQQAEQRAQLDAWGQQIAGAVTDQAPLTKAAIAKRPEATRSTLLQVAVELWRMSGPSDDLREDPTPAQVIQAYEGLLLADLETLGVDTAQYRKTPAKPAPPPAKPAPAASVPAPAPQPTPQPGRKTRLPAAQLVAQLQEERRRQAGT